MSDITTLPTNPETPYSDRTIKKKIETLQGCSTYLTFIKNAFQDDNTALKLGQQLRAVDDYNGTIFEVVREPFKCRVDENGSLSGYVPTRKVRDFLASQRMEAEIFYQQMLGKVNIEDEEQMWDDVHICDVNFRRVRGEEHESETDDSDEEVDDDSMYYSVNWVEYVAQPNTSVQERCWVRKICLISRAEGKVDDKNYRSVVLTRKSVSYEELVWREIQTLSKVARSLEQTRPDSKRTRKLKVWTANKELCDQLKETIHDAHYVKKRIEGFYNKKYNLFLKNPNTYQVTSSGAGAVVQMANKLIEAKADIKETMDNKSSVVKELKRKSDCLITDD